MQKPKPRPHHRTPFVMAQTVLDADGIGFQPLPDHRRIDVIVVAPALVTGVVRRVDKDAVHFARVEWQERFQGVEVVTVNDEIAVERNGADAFGFVGHERAEGHRQMMVVDKLFALETQLRHARPFVVIPVYRSTLISASRLRAWAMS
jgi:hypothetical protein